MEARKMGDQKRLTCPKQKVKKRNVANNYEKKTVQLMLFSMKVSKSQEKTQGLPAPIWLRDVDSTQLFIQTKEIVKIKKMKTGKLVY